VLICPSSRNSLTSGDAHKLSYGQFSPLYFHDLAHHESRQAMLLHSGFHAFALSFLAARRLPALSLPSVEICITACLPAGIPFNSQFRQRG
jgi:hypothetical protein